MLEKYFSKNQSKLLEYIIAAKKEGRTGLPSIQELSEKLEMSVPTLREQIEALKVLGILEARPRHGLEIRPFDFSEGLKQNAIFAVCVDMKYFFQFSEFRDRVEMEWFIPAVENLLDSDINQLFNFIESAKEKLKGNPIQIPHKEHKELHLSIYSRLDNLFVIGVLNTYWDLYELVGMNLYTDLDYQNEVWSYHEKIVQKIKQRDYVKSKELLNDHMKLIYKR